MVMCDVSAFHTPYFASVNRPVDIFVPSIKKVNLFFFVQVVFQERIANRRETEYTRLKKEREDRINEVIASRKREREIKRKLFFYLKSEEERLTKEREEEEARKREGTAH